MVRKLCQSFWNKGWFIIVPLAIAIVAIWVWPGLVVPPIASVSSSGQISERTQALYLLSAIPQTLGAILALVFTIYLVVYQVFSRYTLRVPWGSFGRITIAYIVLFMGSILFPLWTIGTPDTNSVRLSLSLACLSLFLLVPYSLYFKEVISPRYGIAAIKNNVLKNIRGDHQSATEEIETLDNIVMSAYGMKDYDTFFRGIRSFAEIAFEWEKAGLQEEASGSDLNNAEDIADTYNKIESIMRVCIEDPRAPSQVFKALEFIANKAVKEELPSIVDTLINRIGQIGQLVASRGLDELAGDIAMRLGILASVGIDRKWAERLDSSTEEYYSMVSFYLKPMMETSVKSGSDFTIYHILGAYEKIGEVAIRNNNNDLAQKSITAIRECGIEASYNAELKKEAAGAAWEIAHLGATAIINGNELIRDYSISQMRLLEGQLTRERIVDTLNKHIQRWQTFKGDESVKMAEALKKIAEYYSQQK